VQQPPGQIWGRLHRKAKAMQGRIHRLFAPGQAEHNAAEIGDFIDMAEYPKDYIRYARAHWQAMLSYQPRPYPGRITLFRARKQPLLSVDPTLGWGDLAQ